MTAALNPGNTFTVHAVTPAARPLPTCKTHEALAALTGSRVEACCDYTPDCVAGVKLHPLFAAVHQAFSDHRPLVLSPDMIWVAILQGLAQHVKNDPGRYRERFVSHLGKKVLSVARTDLVPGSPENPWPEVVRELSERVHDEIGPEHAWLEADFSTTGPAERAAADIALLDALQPYFEYRTYAVCGIPQVTLEGTAADWRRLAEKVEHLERYDLGWWLEHLRPIARQFVRAAEGDVDLDHWRNLYKRLDAYGGSYANGWLVKLFPYLKDGGTGNFTERNPLLEEPWKAYPPAPAVPQLNRPANRFQVGEPAVYARSLPTGISAAPFTLETLDGRCCALEFLGGFIGVTQDGRTLGLRPKLGWGVRQRSALDQLLLRVREHHAGPAPVPQEFAAVLERLDADTIPGDFLSFYKTFDGADLFPGAGGGPAYRLRGLSSLERVRPKESPADYKAGQVSVSLVGSELQYTPVFDWVRFADLPDGTWLALDFRSQHVRPDDTAPGKPTWTTLRQREVFYVLRCRDDEPDPRRAYRVVAWSFGEFLTKALASAGRLYFDEPGFTDRGDAFSEPQWQGPLPEGVRVSPYEAGETW